MGALPARSKLRGNTLLEIMVAVGLLLLIFLFLTGDLIQSSQAENVVANHTSTVTASNYFLGVMRDDPNFWAPDWAIGNGLTDPCGKPWPPYTDSIVSGPWHPAPACTPGGGNPGAFPDMIGVNTFQFKWNAQTQGGDPRTAELTTWVMVAEGGRTDVYELHSTKGNLPTPPPASGPFPTATPVPTPTPCMTNCVTPTPTPSRSATPKPSPSPTKKPSPTPTPSPSPSGTFE